MPIPEELKIYRQWVVWKRVILPDGKITKLPFNPVTGQKASTIDAATWNDFPTVERLCYPGVYDGLGFVLTKSDPYACIDLDDPKGDSAVVNLQLKIAQEFDTYAELSPSGKGLHLWCKGSIPMGRRRNCVELYSSERYMTITGKTYEPLNKPITDRQFMLEQLWKEMGDTHNGFADVVIEQPEIYSDETIYNMACAADNGAKFLALWRGEWHQHYSSQSEADFAIINILCFYSRNVNQVHRLFRASALGKREKAERQKYVMPMIQRSFDNQPPPIDLSGIASQVKRQIDDATNHDKHNPFAGPLFESVPDEQYDWRLPPGLLGGIAEFIYQSSPRPVKEIALAASIGMLSGICGRSFNVSGTGLNQYVMILAPTGTGKEAASSGIDHLINLLQVSVPAIKEFIGPGDIASGQALAKYLPTHPCFVSIVGEFGLLLKRLCSENASGPDVRLLKMLLALYNKSGAGEALRPTIYSDKEQTTDLVYSPSFSVLGESTPDVFYQAIDEAMVSKGLFPRFTCIEYTGKRPPLNADHNQVQPTPQLLSELAALGSACLAMNQSGKVIQIAFAPDGQAICDKFNIRCDALINGTDLEIIRQLWTRAHVKAMKLAALLAVGISFYEPVITAEAMQWAIDLVQRDISNIMRRYDSGKIGLDANEVGQIEEVRAVIAEFLVRPWDSFAKTSGITEDMHKERIITMAYVQKKLLPNRQFRTDRIGASNAIKRAVQSFVTDGSLIKITPAIAWTRFNKHAEILAVADGFRFFSPAKRERG